MVLAREGPRNREISASADHHILRHWRNYNRHFSLDRAFRAVANWRGFAECVHFSAA